MIGEPFSVVEQMLRALDPQLEVDDSGATSHSLGIAVYCPAHEEDRQSHVEGVFVFSRGYYDS
jgi:hypothetical protein